MTKRKYSASINTSQVRPDASNASSLCLYLAAGVMLIVIASIFTYQPCLNGGFIVDDDRLLTDNALIESTDGLYRFWFTADPIDYWPVSNSMLWIEWRLWGMNPAGYHITNLILHIAEALLIWVILHRLSIPGAFLAAFIFALHPVNVESVAWIAQVKTLMAMLFFLLSILWYLIFLERARRPTFQPKAEYPLAAKQILSTVHRPLPTFLWYLLSLAAFILAMLSKGSAAVLPVLLVGIIWWLRPLKLSDIVRIVPFFAVAVVLTLVNIWFQTHGEVDYIRNADFTERLLGAGGIVWFYLFKAFLPIDLVFVYPQWEINTKIPLWWLPLAAAIVVSIVLWLYRKTWSRPILFAWGFFCASLVPVMGFTDVGFMKHSLVADHYQHIAIIAVITLAAAGFCVWRRHFLRSGYWASNTVAVLAIVILAFLTWRQNRLYSDPITLYQATLDKNPQCWMAHNNLGKILALNGQSLDAITHFQAVIRLNPKYAMAHNNYGNALSNLDRKQEAIEQYKEAIRLNSKYPQSYYNLATLFAQTNRLHDAVEHFQKAIDLKPDYFEAYNNLENVLREMGQLNKATDAYNKALDINPDFADVHYNLGMALLLASRFQEAKEHCLRTIKLKPDFAEAYYALASAYAGANQPDEVVKNVRNALDLAQSQGKTMLVRQIETWFNSYRAGLSNPPSTAPGPKMPAPP